MNFRHFVMKLRKNLSPLCRFTNHKPQRAKIWALAWISQTQRQAKLEIYKGFQNAFDFEKELKFEYLFCAFF